MQEPLFNYLDDLYANGLKAIQQAEKNSTVFWAELSHTQLKLLEQWLDYSNQQLELLATEKNVRDLYQAEAELMVDYGKQIAESMHRLADSTPVDLPLGWPLSPIPVPGAGAGKPKARQRTGKTA